MNISTRAIALLISLVFLSDPVAAEISCSFTLRSTFEGNERLADHAFRVRDRLLEQRYADGTWRPLGAVERFDQPGFTVFLHLPHEGPSIGRVRMLTVHDSGASSLTIHYGSSGSGDQIRKAWLLQGECIGH